MHVGVGARKGHFSSALKQPSCPPAIPQTLQNSGYAMSTTNLRLVHGDQCTGVSAVIPDTDGKGGGGGGKPHDGGGGSGGGRSGVKTFFLLVLVTGG